MIQILMLAAAMNMAMAAPLSANTPACQIDRARSKAMMASAYDAFDQSADGDLSWRVVMNTGCYDTAASLIAAYLTANSAQLTDEQTRTLNFHIAQTYAIGGEDQKAPPYLTKARGGTSDEWNAYVDATLAFVTKDRLAFDAAQKRYETVAPNSPRRAFLASFARCFESRYAQAMSCSKAAL